MSDKNAGMSRMLLVVGDLDLLCLFRSGTMCKGIMDGLLLVRKARRC